MLSIKETRESKKKLLLHLTVSPKEKMKTAKWTNSVREHEVVFSVIAIEIFLSEHCFNKKV